MEAFLTGSRVYGTPHEKSDIDIVVFATEDTMLALGELCQDGEAVCESYGDMSVFRFGRLNVLMTCKPERYQAWLKGTAELTAKKPVTRDEAVATFQRLFTEFCCGNSHKEEKAEDVQLAAVESLSTE